MGNFKLVWMAIFLALELTKLQHSTKLVWIFFFDSDFCLNNFQEINSERVNFDIYNFLRVGGCLLRLSSGCLLTYMRHFGIINSQIFIFKKTLLKSFLVTKPLPYLKEITL